MRFKVAAFLLALSGSAAASWVLSSKASATDQVKIIIAVKHKKEGAKLLEKELWERSDPASGNYGQWMSRDEVSQL